MKKHSKISENIKALLFFLIISALIFGATVICWNCVIMKLHFNARNLLFTIIILLIGLASLVATLTFIGSIITLSIENHYYTKENAKSLEIVKNKLSNEFTEIKIGENGFPFNFKNEDIKCMAKLDEYNNIIYKIQVDTAIASDDYKTFTDYFEV
ncbi:MAG: hypothetical protein E7311_07310 [Clostridiales bacterium]|nr:hypothetical protein [Clostridiales bacterium]